MRWYLVICVVVLLPGVGEAGFPWFDRWKSRDCDECDRPCPEEVRRRPQRYQAAQPRGVYAQPPAVGEQHGEATGHGIHGMRLRIPEFTLELPSIEFPGRYSIRRDATMHIDRASAPYTYGQAATYGMVAPGGVRRQRVDLYRLQTEEEEVEEVTEPGCEPAECDPHYERPVPPPEDDTGWRYPPAPAARARARSGEVEELAQQVEQLTKIVEVLATAQQRELQQEAAQRQRDRREPGRLTRERERELRRRIEQAEYRREQRAHLKPAGVTGDSDFFEPPRAIEIEPTRGPRRSHEAPVRPIPMDDPPRRHESRATRPSTDAATRRSSEPLFSDVDQTRYRWNNTRDDSRRDDRTTAGRARVESPASDRKKELAGSSKRSGLARLFGR